MKTILKNKFSIALLLAVFTISCSSAASGNQANAGTNALNSADNTSAGQGTGSGAAAEMAQTAPEVIVADLYKQHDAKKGPFFQDKDRAVVDKYFVKPIADAIWKDSTRANKNEEVGILDADPLYNGQDFEIKNFKVGKGTVSGDKATVVVTFDNFGKKQSLKFSLVAEKNAWKISDIDYGDNLTLAKWLNGTYEGKAEESPSGEFEGRYQVGTVTCTVKPVKMAFEVRWAKGSGVEMFFASGDGSYNFASEEDAKGGTNTFFFDDENYNSGTFRRADGKEMTVKRIK